MSTLPASVSGFVVPLAPQKFNTVAIRGKITLSRKLPKGGFATRFTLPATDEYSSAQNVEVYSKEKIGDREEILTVVCVLGGYYKRQSNKETGEMYEFTTNVLRAVE